MGDVVLAQHGQHEFRILELGRACDDNGQGQMFRPFQHVCFRIIANQYGRMYGRMASEIVADPLHIGSVAGSKESHIANSLFHAAIRNFGLFFSVLCFEEATPSPKRAAKISIKRKKGSRAIRDFNTLLCTGAVWSRHVFSELNSFGAHVVDLYVINIFL